LKYVTLESQLSLLGIPGYESITQRLTGRLVTLSSQNVRVCEDDEDTEDDIYL